MFVSATRLSCLRSSPSFSFLLRPILFSPFSYQPSLSLSLTLESGGGTILLLFLSLSLSHSQFALALGRVVVRSRC